LPNIFLVKFFQESIYSKTRHTYFSTLPTLWWLKHPHPIKDMVTIINYAKRTNEEGKPFFALILQGGIHMMQSKKSGQYYATAKKASIPSTFDEDFCKSVVGSKLHGEIIKEKSDPYQYRIDGTEETITLTYRWKFKPATNLEMEIFEMENEQPESI
jgi:hypothetical protein